MHWILLAIPGLAWACCGPHKPCSSAWATAPSQAPFWQQSPTGPVSQPGSTWNTLPCLTALTVLLVFLPGLRDITDTDATLLYIRFTVVVFRIEVLEFV